METSLIIFGISCLLIIVIIGLFINLESTIKDTTKYLNDLHYITSAQIKSELNRNYRYSLIKNLRFMKKYVGISLMVIIISIVIAGGIIFNDSRDYFMDYFEAKRQKLNLMHEASVDSLQNVITYQLKTIDSLSNKFESNQEIIETLKTQIESVNKSNANFQYNIRHQNQMIEKLVKENTELKNK